MYVSVWLLYVCVPWRFHKHQYDEVNRYVEVCDVCVRMIAYVCVPWRFQTQQYDEVNWYADVCDVYVCV